MESRIGIWQIYIDIMLYDILDLLEEVISTMKTLHANVETDMKEKALSESSMEEFQKLDAMYNTDIPLVSLRLF